MQIRFALLPRLMRERGRAGHVAKCTCVCPELCSLLTRICGNYHSGAAKVDFSPESCILLRKHETLHKCSLVHIDH